jgi:hypothetical protein
MASNTIKIDLVIPRQEARREYFRIGHTTLERRERDDPNFPKRVRMSRGPGGETRYGYRLSDIQRYFNSFVEDPPKPIQKKRGARR